MIINRMLSHPFPASLFPSSRKMPRDSATPQSTTQPVVSRVVAPVALILVYFVSGKIGLSVAFLNASATAIWPPTGIALAALLLGGYRLWPAVFIGAFLVNITTQGSAIMSLAIASGNTLEAITGAWLVQRFAGGVKAFFKASDILKFTALAAMASTAISATIGVTSLCLGHLGDWDQYGSMWLTWWLGDMISDLTIASLLLIWAGKPRPRLDQHQLLEAATLFATIVAVGAIVFPATLPFHNKNIPIGYIALLPLLWAAFRFGRRGAIVCALLTSAIALAGTLRGVGPFVEQHNPNESLILAQAFVGTLTLMSLLVAAVVADHHRAEQALDQARADLKAHAEELEQTVAERTAQLRESNAELEAFSFSLSHDLRAPLRSIQGFTQLALEDCREALGPHAANLDKVLSATRRMDRLIRDVLAFSRVSRTKMNVHPLDLEKLVRAIANERPDLQPPRANILVDGPLPTILGDEASLTQCVTNLLDNAVKFMAADIMPKVIISSEPAADKVRFLFADNGIGIDPRALPAIFDMFHRAHGATKYEGSGIGLAIVRKAVERMAGAVGVESEPGKGSRFWIELPKA
jgi:signal transduction histidine kinase